MTKAVERLPEVVEPLGSLWPPADGSTAVVLARADTAVERRLIEAWAAQRDGSSGGLQVAHDGDGAVAGGRQADAAIVPARLAWLPRERGGELRYGLRELPQVLPPRLRARAQQSLLARAPDRCRLIVGEPARLSELEARWTERAGAASPTAGAFGGFVERQADIALERAQRRVSGERYRAPRAVAQELGTSPELIAAADQLAAELGREPEGVLADTRTYLAEMATEQQRLARDLWAQLSRFLYSRAYDLRVDEAALERIRALGSRCPLVFLPSHRSNLDGFVMASLLYEHDFPANHTLGGINMAFWPLGALGRRVGVVWIRRSFRDNEVYKFALQRYLAYLASKRFNLEWYIEGGRSRTGKLLPPRLGLFNYLANAVEDLGVRDVHVIPTSIVYDQLQEAGEMTSESRGAAKRQEGLGWLLRYARAQRGSFGAVHVNFGEPIELAEALHAQGSSATADPDTRRLARSKVAFEVCARINRATPATATSLATLALLGTADRALTLDEVSEVLAPLLAYVEVRAIPVDRAARELGERSGLERTLARLTEHDVVEHYAEGAEPVYRIGPDLKLVAAFYRNTSIQWFIARAIIELALLRAAETAPGEDPIEPAWEEAFRLRDLLKFEFFFADKDEFEADLRAEVALIEPDWGERGPERLAEVGRALADSGALLAHRVLRSFVEAYYIVAEHLESLGDAPADGDEVERDCLALGRQYRLQRRVTSGEALSTHLFRSALKLAANRGLLDAGGGVAQRRGEHADEVRDVLRRLWAIDRLDQERSLAGAGRPATSEAVQAAPSASGTVPAT